MCVPGQEIVSPCDGVMIRSAYPYKGTREWKGCVIATGKLQVKLFYVDIDVDMIGRRVAAGDRIGVAQDITKKYPNSDMTPHVHMGVFIKVGDINGKALSPQILI